MKIAVAQINTTIGDFDGNTAKIIDRIGWAKLNGASIVVFPEMTITGYPPKDFLDKPYFIQRNMECLEKIASQTDDKIAAVVGYIAVNESAKGKGLFNSAAFLSEGKIKHTQNKTLLPTYDVFDEARYFEAGKEHEPIEYKGKRFGLTICEDVWFSADFGGRKLYDVDPVDIMAGKRLDFILNSSASPYMVGKRQLRKNLLGRLAAQYSIPIVYSNIVGGNDELIFDGASMVIGSNGEIVREAEAFVEDSFIVDLDAGGGERFEIDSLDETEEVFEALVLGTRDYIKKCGFNKVVIGLSGGIDSSVVAAIAADAIGPKNVMGIAMPTRYSSKESLDDSRELAKRLSINFKVIGIDKLYQEYLDLLTPEFIGKSEDTTEENIQARIRGNILMAFSNKFHAMVMSTGNKSELAVGYCTLYGDLAGGLAVISDVPKTMVYELAGFINRDEELIPLNIISRPPSAELKPDQIDQDSLPPYEILDQILKAYIEDRLSVQAIIREGFEKEIVEDVVRKIDRSEYKRRQAPPGLKVTSKAFGWGRRCPVACKC